MDNLKKDEMQIGKFLANFPTIDYEKGRIILFQGEVPRDAHIIKSGIVKVYNIDDDGNEQLIYFKTAGDVFPFTWVMNKTPSTQYYYETVTECSIFVLPRERYLDVIKSSKKLMFEQIEADAVRDRLKTVRLNALIHAKASDKVVHILHYLMLGYGRKADHDKVVISVILTQQDIANMVGLTRETVSLEIGKLRKQGVITSGRSLNYVVHLDKFSEYLKDQFLIQTLK